MSELRFICQMIGNSEGTTLRFRNNNRITAEKAEELLLNIQKELRYSITLARLNALRALLNPSGIGIHQGNVAKRKYVRKGEIEEEVVKPVEVPKVEKNLHGLLFPIGSIIQTQKNSTNGLYEVIDVIDARNARIKPLKSHSSGTNYSIDSLNHSVLTKMWTIQNPSEELLLKIKNYTNLVTSDKFKRNNTDKNDTKNYNYGSNFVISIGSRGYETHIPVTPGFTGNCQLSIIGQMQTLVQISTHLKEQLQEVYKICGRRLLLCDVRSEVVSPIEQKLGVQCIHSKLQYKSTNGSSMVIVLIDLSKL